MAFARWTNKLRLKWIAKLVRWNVRQNRVWIVNQRIHHGPSGLCLAGVAYITHHKRAAIACVLWALTDLRDCKVWFKLGPQFGLEGLDNKPFFVASATRE